MLIDTLLFYVFALLVLGGGVLTITRRSAVHSAISLIVSLLGVAGLYLLQQAEFLFAVQIILYIGGIMLLFLFVIMLAVSIAVAGEFAWFLSKGSGAFALAPARGGVPFPGNTEEVADVLFQQYLLPFEIASVLLLVAVVGSVVMAKKRI
jgi:NADH-quinone oxidoreductase subunit J